MTHFFPLIAFGKFNDDESFVLHLKLLWVAVYFTIVHKVSNRKRKLPTTRAGKWFGKLMSRTSEFETNWAIALELRFIKWAGKLTFYIVEDE